MAALGIREKISVCTPVYNGASTIADTIHSILCQSLRDFEFVIVDNASCDNTAQIVRSFSDPRIRFYQNGSNIGIGGNMDACWHKATGDILFYLSADDIADKDALKKVYEAFQTAPDVGIVERPYYWFDADVSVPVRATRQFKEEQVASINDPFDKTALVLALADQISGIGFRKKYMLGNFGRDYFVEMSAMTAAVFKNYRAVILRDNIVAIRMQSSVTLNSFVYRKSPMKNWNQMIEDTFPEDSFKKLRKYLRYNFVANNYIGLVQIKNYGTYPDLLREIFALAAMRWMNVFNLKFLFFSIGTMLIPKFILRQLVVIYKNKVNSALLKGLKTVQTGE